MAAQLIATNGPLPRGLLRWIARATSSLPVPDSPCSRTVAEADATWAMVSRTLRMAGLVPMRLRSPATASSSWRRARFSAFRAAFSCARVTLRTTSGRFKGLVTKS